jgi:hypothetical protein
MNAKTRYQLEHQPSATHPVQWANLDQKQQDTVTRSWGIETATEYYYLVDDHGNVISRREIDRDMLE